MATRLIMIKADGTVLIHADSGTKALTGCLRAVGSARARLSNLTRAKAARSRQIAKYRNADSARPVALPTARVRRADRPFGRGMTSPVQDTLIAATGRRPW